VPVFISRVPSLNVGIYLLLNCLLDVYSVRITYLCGWDCYIVFVLYVCLSVLNQLIR